MKALLVGVLCLAPLAHVASAGEHAAAQPVVSGEAARVLDLAREKVKGIRALSYTATMGEGEEAVRAEVSLVRADAGGWKVAAKGESPVAGGGKTSFQVGHDGVTARSLRDSEQTVVELSPRAETDLFRFFNMQNARWPIVWELLEEKPYEFAARSISLAGTANVEGVLCDIVVVTEPEIDGKPRAGSPVVRYYFGAEDRLPRRVERTVALAGGGEPPEPGSVVTFSGIRLDREARAGQFVLAIPDGYKVRNLRAATPTERPAGDPPPVASRPTRETLAVGDTAPNFTLKDFDGKDWSLTDFRGKIVVLDFWGTWCPPCVQATPHIQRVHEKFAGRDVVVLGLDSDSPDVDVKGWMDKRGLTYKTLLRSETIARDFKVPGWPTMYVLDREGKVIWAKVGFSQTLEADLTEVINKALAGEG